MIKTVVAAAFAVLFASHTPAAERLTKEQAQQAIDATDAAAMQRDTRGIGEHPSERFQKTVEVPYHRHAASTQLDKRGYLQLIEQGWSTPGQYSYRREDTVIRIAADGLSAESSATIIETLLIDGEPRVSKVRKYAQYALENGKAVITTTGGHPLVGDTTPEAGQ